MINLTLTYFTKLFTHFHGVFECPVLDRDQDCLVLTDDLILGQGDLVDEGARNVPPGASVDNIAIWGGGIIHTVSILNTFFLAQ